MLHKVKIKKNQLLIAYKLLSDALFITLSFLLLALIAEGILPGIITSHVGFSEIITFIGFALIASYLISKSTGISLEKKKINKKTAFLMLSIFILLVFNSLIKINIFLGLLILTFTLASAYFIYKVVIEEAE